MRFGRANRRIEIGTNTVKTLLEGSYTFRIATTIPLLLSTASEGSTAVASVTIQRKADTAVNDDRVPSLVVDTGEPVTIGSLVYLSLSDVQVTQAYSLQNTMQVVQHMRRMMRHMAKHAGVDSCVHSWRQWLSSRSLLT